MSSVDERVVRMQFDNSGFEAGATRAIGILDRLGEALKLNGASSGLESAKKAISNFTMDPISKSVDVCSSKFTAFEATVFGIFSSLGNRIFGFSENLVKNLTIKPLMDGFGEYETQMRSVQTILSNTRSKLSESGITEESDQIALINSKLDELNEYADKTIYNFSEMTRNIGTFTAAGVDLNTATQSIQGIANLAAASGSTSQQASTAMYQLSQAIASGTVKLQDWNSVVNAGMGGELFQEALKRTARNMGTDVDTIIEKAGSFRESLQAGWINSDVLTETLKQLTMSYEEVGDEAYNANLEILRNEGYSKEDAVAILDLAKNAQEAATKVRTWTQLWDTVGEALGSGWATTWRTIVGDFSEATDLFTHLSDRITSLIGASADARNSMLADWSAAGGRDALVLGIKNTVDAIYSTIEAIGKAFSEVFGITAEQIYNISEAFADFSKKLVPSQDAVNGIYSICYDLFTIIHSIIGIAGNFIRIFVSAAKILWDFAEPIRWLASDIFVSVLTGLASFSSKVLAFTDTLEEKIPGFLTNIKEMSVYLINTVFDMGTSLVRTLTAPIRAFDRFFGVSKFLIGVVKNIGNAIKSFIDSFDVYTIVDKVKILDKYMVVDLRSTFRKFGIEWLFDLAAELSQAFDVFSKAFEDSVFAFFKVVKFLCDDISHIASTFVTVLSEFFGSFDILSEIEGKASGFIDVIKNFVKNGVQGLIDSLNEYSNSSPEDIRSSGIIGWIYGIVGYLQEAESKLSDFSLSFGDSMREFLENSKIFGAIRDFINAVPTWGSNFLNQAKNFVKGSKLLEKSKSVLSSFGSKVLPAVTNAFSSFGKKIKSVVSTVVDYFKTLTPQKLKDDVLDAVSKIQSKLDTFAPFFSGIFSNISSKFTNFVSAITEGSSTFGDVFSNIKDSIVNSFANMPDTVKSLFDRVVELFNYGKENLQNEAFELSFDNVTTNFANLGTNLASAIGGIGEGLLSVPDVVGGGFGTLLGDIEGFLGKLPSFDNVESWVGPLLSGGLAVSLIGMVRSIKTLAKTLSGVGKGIIDWPKSFGDAIAKFGQGFNKWREETKADQIVKIATALAILAAALFVIASIPADDLERAGSAMAKMAIGVASFLVIFSLMDKFKVTNAAALTSMGIALQGLGIGMLGLAAAAFVLSNIPDDQLKKGADAVIELVAALSLYMYAVGKSSGSLTSAGLGIIFLAGGVYLLSYAIEKFGNMDTKAVYQGLNAFDRIMFSLSLFGALGAEGIASLLRSTALLGVGILTLSIGFIFLTGALLVMSNALKTIDNLWAVVGVMAGTIIVFSLAAALLKDADPAAVGAGLMMLAGAIVVMSLGFALLNGVDWEEIAAGALAMAGLMTVLFLITKFTKYPSDLIATGQAMVLLGASILIMSFGLGILAGFDWQSLVIGAAVVAGIMIVFAGMSKLVEPERLMQAGMAMLALSGSILIIAAAFKVFETIDSASIQTTVWIIAGMFAGLTLMAMLLNPMVLSTIGGALIGFSVSILILAAAFKAFEMVNPDSIMTTLISMGGAMAIFVAAAWLLAPVAPVLGGVAMAMLTFAASVLVLAAAFWVVAEAIRVLDEIGPEGVIMTMWAFGVGLGLIIDQLAARAPEIGKALVNLAIAVFQTLIAALAPIFQSIGAWLQANAPLFFEWGKNVVLKIFEAFGRAYEYLKEHLPAIVAAIGEFVSNIVSVLGPIGMKLLEGLKTLASTIATHAGPAIMNIVEKIKTLIIEKGPVLLDALLNWKDSILSGFGSWAGSMVEAGGQLISDLKSGIQDKISDAVDAALDAGRNLIEGIKTGISEKVSELATSAYETFTNFIQPVRDFFGVQSPSTVMQEIGGNIVQGLINGIGDFIGSLGDKALELGGAFINGIGDLAGGLKDKAVDGMTAFTGGVGSFIGGVTTKGSEIVGGVINGAKDLAGKMKTKATDGMNSFVSGMSSKISTVKSTASKVASGVVDGFKNLASSLKSKVSSAMDGVRSAISGASGKISGAVSGIKNTIVGAFSGLFDQLKSVGQSIGDGLVVGMNNKVDAAYRAGVNLGNATVRGTKSVPQVASPSKVMIKIGQYIGDGLVIGMSNRIKQIEKTGEKLGRNAIDGCNDAVGKMALSIQDVMDTDYEPVITPVINPAQFNSDLSALNRAMNTNMNRIVLDGMNYNTELNAKMVDYADSNNKALQAIADGVIDYNLLGNAVAMALINSGLHVEMDGGQLMGYLAGEIRDARRMYG